MVNNYTPDIIMIVFLLFMAMQLAVAVAIGRVNLNTRRIVKQLDRITELLSPYAGGKK